MTTGGWLQNGAISYFIKAQILHQKLSYVNPGSLSSFCWFVDCVMRRVYYLHVSVKGLTEQKSYFVLAQTIAGLWNALE